MSAEIIRFDSRRADSARHRLAADQGEETWCRKPQIAEHFAVSERTIERWQARGMPCNRMGARLTLFRLSECERWVRAHE